MDRPERISAVILAGLIGFPTWNSFVRKSDIVRGMNWAEYRTAQILFFVSAGLFFYLLIRLFFGGRKK